MQEYKANHHAMSQLLSYDFDPDVIEAIQLQFQQDANRVFVNEDELALALDEETGVVTVVTTYQSLQTNAEYEGQFLMQRNPETNVYCCVRIRMIRRPYPDLLGEG